MPFERGPYLNIATFCELVVESKQGVLSLINVVDRHIIQLMGPNPPEQMPPSLLNWSLVLSFKSGETRGTHQVRVTPELPSGLKVQSAELPAHFEGGSRGVNLILKAGMELKEPGLYWFWVEFDREFVTKVPVEVIYARMATPQLPLSG